MSAAERVYSLLLRVYPADFRAEFGGELALLFRDRRRDEGAGPRFWLEMVVDLARSALPLRVEALRGRRAPSRSGMFTATGEGEMMATVMAVLAIMIGALETAGAFTEFYAAIQHLGAGSPASLYGGTMGMVAGVFLLAAGVALLRRSPGAVRLARAASVTCIVVFVLISYVIPMMGYFAQLLGIGFPLILLLYLRRGRIEVAGAPISAPASSAT